MKCHVVFLNMTVAVYPFCSSNILLFSPDLGLFFPHYGGHSSMFAAASGSGEIVPGAPSLMRHGPLVAAGVARFLPSLIDPGTL